MQLDQALAQLLEAAAEAGARKALEAVAAQAPSSLIPIKSAGVSHRALLAAAKRGELTIHRRGKAGFVDRDELERWIRTKPEREKSPDEVAEVLELNANRRRCAK